MSCDWAIIECFEMEVVEGRRWQARATVRNVGLVEILVDDLKSDAPKVAAIERDDRRVGYPIILKHNQSIDLNFSGYFLSPASSEVCDEEAMFSVAVTQFGEEKVMAHLCLKRSVRVTHKEAYLLA